MQNLIILSKKGGPKVLFYWSFLYPSNPWHRYLGLLEAKRKKCTKLYEGHKSECNLYMLAWYVWFFFEAPTPLVPQVRTSENS